MGEPDEVPPYFICPISLEIMKDPVTIRSGITYDRDSIERWLFIDRRLTCPVTNEPIPADAELTPNHTLRRLIQSWSSLHAANRIPTPRPPADLETVQNLLRNLSPSSLSLLSSLAAESESNRRLIIRAGAPRRLISFLPTASISPADSTLALLLSLRVPQDDLKPLISENHELISSLIPLIPQSSSAIQFL
ncbi:E3 ubiquitin-protein ligase PUB23-like, partial [Phalaenopsis equestris]|uniref:E3 ubiquitin-protein ligase PUB23-like n=1 Tax=Phalaenopsis equestris TaxID=78828 RepID=UPI0009E37BF8